MAISSRTAPLVCAVLACLVFTLFLHRPARVTVHERRVIEPARRMVDAGWPWRASVEVGVPSVVRAGDETLVVSGTRRMAVNPWMLPVFEDAVRIAKPPLANWCAAACMVIVGDDTIAGRLIPALLAAGGVLLIGRLGRRVLGRVGGTYTMLAWISCLFIVTEYRRAMTDPYLAFGVLLFAAAWVELSLAERPTRRVLWTIGLFAGLAIGLFAKGPVMFLHAALVIACVLAARRRRAHLPWLAWIAGLSLAALPLALWARWVMLNVPDALELWRYQSIGQFDDNTRNERPAWFYLPLIGIVSAPWICALLGDAVFSIVRRQRRRFFPLLWFALTLTVFSLTTMKKASYLLPAMPAVCLMIGAALRNGQAAARLARRRGMPAPTVVLTVDRLLAAALGLALAGVLGFRAFDSSVTLSSGGKAELIVSGVLAVAATAALATLRSAYTLPTLLRMAIGICGLALAYLVNKDRLG